MTDQTVTSLIADAVRDEDTLAEPVHSLAIAGAVSDRLTADRDQLAGWIADTAQMAEAMGAGMQASADRIIASYRDKMEIIAAALAQLDANPTATVAPHRLI